MFIDIIIRYRDHEESLTPAQFAAILKKDLIEIIPHGNAYDDDFDGKVFYWQFRREWLNDSPEWIVARYYRYLDKIKNEAATDEG